MRYETSYNGFCQGSGYRICVCEVRECLHSWVPRSHTTPHLTVPQNMCHSRKTPIFSLFTVIINSLCEGGRAGSVETAHFSHCLFALRL